MKRIRRKTARKRERKEAIQGGSRGNTGEKDCSERCKAARKGGSDKRGEEGRNKQLEEVRGGTRKEGRE